MLEIYIFTYLLDHSIGSGNFSVTGYLPLIRKDSTTHMNALTVYAKEGIPFAQDLSLENSADSYLCFWMALLHSVHNRHHVCLYQKDKFSDSKVKFRQASNHCKRVLEAAKLAYANKTKESETCLSGLFANCK